MSYSGTTGSSSSSQQVSVLGKRLRTAVSVNKSQEQRLADMKLTNDAQDLLINNLAGGDGPPVNITALTEQVLQFKADQAAQNIADNNRFATLELQLAQAQATIASHTGSLNTHSTNIQNAQTAITGIQNQIGSFNPANYYTSTQVDSAIAPYLTQADATGLYYTKSATDTKLQPYLLSADATGLYYTKTAVNALLTGYLTTAVAASTYATIASLNTANTTLNQHTTTLNSHTTDIGTLTGRCNNIDLAITDLENLKANLSVVYTSAQVDSLLTGYQIKPATGQSFVTNVSLTSTLASYPTNGSLTTTLSSYATTAALAPYATQVWVDTGYTTKAAFEALEIPDLSGVYTKSQTDTLLTGYYTKAQIDTTFGNVYTKAQVDSTFAGYYTITVINSTLDSYYTKTQVDTTLTGYYTAAQVNTALGSYYTKTQIDATFADYYTEIQVNTLLADYYTKTQIDTQATGYVSAANITAALEIWSPKAYKTGENDTYVNFHNWYENVVLPTVTTVSTATLNTWGQPTASLNLGGQDITNYKNNTTAWPAATVLPSRNQIEAYITTKVPSTIYFKTGGFEFPDPAGGYSLPYTLTCKGAITAATIVDCVGNSPGDLWIQLTWPACANGDYYYPVFTTIDMFQGSAGYPIDAGDNRWKYANDYSPVVITRGSLTTTGCKVTVGEGRDLYVTGGYILVTLISSSDSSTFGMDAINSGSVVVY